MLNRGNSLEAQKHGYSFKSPKRYDDMKDIQIRKKE
jgi:hypothetical protein